MKILIANIGSTSLKWRLFDFSNGAVAAQVGQVISVQGIPCPHDDLGGLGKWL